MTEQPTGAVMNDNQGTPGHTREPVKRFDLEFADPYGYREGMILAEAEDGDYVFYSDYATLRARVSTLEGVLKFALNESGCDGDLCCHEWHERARAALNGGQHE